MLPKLRARTTPQASVIQPANHLDDKMARIWLTYKTRIKSEERFKGYALVSHLALTWYAFLSIVFSIYQSEISVQLGPEGANKAGLVISVLTFGLSLIIYGFKFEDNARTHRECYLRMQILYQSSLSNSDKLEEYRKLLEHYPNHSDRDYKRMLLDGWRADRRHTDTGGNVITFSWVDIIKEYAIFGAEYVFLFTLFVIPPILIARWAGI